MGTPRFFCPHLPPDARLYALPPEAAHHAVRVLRLRVGDALSVFDGGGGEYPGRVAAIDKNAVTVELGPHRAHECESPLHITLAQGISSGDKMDFTLQKAVELGIAAIQPLATERSVVRLTGERAQKRVEHWQQVVVSACEQCGRNRVPSVHPIRTPDVWLADLADDSLRLTLAPGAAHALRDLPRPARPLLLLIGPEGGLSPAELHAAAAHGFQPLRLGPRILRTETAALAALAAMQGVWGDF